MKGIDVESISSSALLVYVFIHLILYCSPDMKYAFRIFVMDRHNNGFYLVTRRQGKSALYDWRKTSDLGLVQTAPILDNQ